MCDWKKIDRYLIDGLPPEAEDALRAHLGECEACRAHYDSQVALLRGLSGKPDRPTAGEDARLAGLVLRRSGLSAPAPAAREGLWTRLIWSRRPILALGLAGGALVLLVGAVIAAFALSGHVRVGRLTGGRGLTVNDRAVAPKALRGLDVSTSQVLRTDRTGLARIALERGGTIRVFPDTRLSFSDGGREIDLASGKVWCEIEPGRGRFVVWTEQAAVEVIGTSFVVEQPADGGTEVRVMHGRVRVMDHEGRGQIALQDRQQTTVAHASPPAAARPYLPLRDRGDWDRIWNRFVQGWVRAGHKLQKLIDSLE